MKNPQKRRKKWCVSPGQAATEGEAGKTQHCRCTRLDGITRVIPTLVLVVSGTTIPSRSRATPSRSEASYWNGDVSWVSSGEVQFCRIKATREKITVAGLANSSTRLNPSGSVLLGMIGEGKTRGQAAILDLEACNNQNCAAIWVSETPIRPEFVYYFLWSQYEETRRGSSGNNYRSEQS